MLITVGKMGGCLAARSLAKHVEKSTGRLQERNRGKEMDRRTPQIGRAMKEYFVNEEVQIHVRVFSGWEATKKGPSYTR